MRALQLSTYSGGGGAAIAARRLHDGLLSIGVESTMVVANKVGPGANVRQVERVAGPIDRLWRQIELQLHTAELNRYRHTRSPHLEFFSDDRMPGRDMLQAAMPKADVCNLHWVSGLVDYRRFFGTIRPSMPVVWTLHDMNTFTGGCHYTMGCEKYARSCGACPQLGSRDTHDISERIHRRKAQALSHRDETITRIVAPSHWLAGQASRSSMLGRFDVEVIPNGLDVDVFAPRDRAVAREVFGLPHDKPVLLFSADATGTYRKGFDLLTAALAKLTRSQPAILAALGHGSDSIGPHVFGMGRVDNERMLSFAYSAADLFVLPTRADNLPNVLLEAMACGTPVASFDIGGIPDVVRPGETGFLSPPESVEGLVRSIEDALSDPGRLKSMGERCRSQTVANHSLQTQARRYQRLYSDLLAETERARVSPARAAIHLANS
jgi:glycosyltransferase involved in cell wall biosynthesis